MNGSAIGMDTNGDDPMAAMLENNAKNKNATNIFLNQLHNIKTQPNATLDQRYLMELMHQMYQNVSYASYEQKIPVGYLVEFLEYYSASEFDR